VRSRITAGGSTTLAAISDAHRISPRMRRWTPIEMG
jgi:hypothetical protein